MTVPTEICYAELAWTGVETVFTPLGLRANDVAHVAVGYLVAGQPGVPLTLGVHYSASLDASKAITVVPLALPAAPRTLYFRRRTPALQAIDFANLAKYSAGVHTDLHDAAAFRDAELWADLAARASWSPVLAVVADGARRVQQIAGWVGGFGTQPATGQYVGATGYVAGIADAADVRGPVGATGPGTGDASGPASAADGDVALFDGATGKLIKDGGTFASLFAKAVLDDEVNVAGANPCDIGAAASARILITGGAGNVSFSAAVKRVRIVRFPAGKTIKHNATALALLAGADRVTAAGDQGVYISDSAGNWRELDYQRADGKAPVTAIVDADIATAMLTPRMLAAAAIAQGVFMLNGTIVTSRTGNAETYALKTLAGTDPSAADPVHCFFPNDAGGYTAVKQVAALSLTISSGSTLGAVNGVAFNVTHTLHYDATGPSISMGAVQCKSSTSDVLALDGHGTVTTVAEGGAGAADNAQTFYTAAALVSKPYIVIGRSVYAGLAAAGTWVTAPVRTRLNTAGFVLPGKVVKQAYGELLTAPAAVGASFAASGLQVTIALKDPGNVVLGTAYAGLLGNSTTELNFIRASRDGVTPLQPPTSPSSRIAGGAVGYTPGASAGASSALAFRDAPNDVLSHDYKLELRSLSAAAYINRSHTDTDSASYPRTSSTMTAMEIQA